MKIALELSGMPRIYAESSASWGKILGRYQPDVYIHTWSQGPDQDNSAIEQLKEIFNPVGMVIDQPLIIDESLYPDRHWPYTSVYRSLSMWNSVKRSHSMVINSGKHYDIIIRGRTDWYVKNLVLEEHDALVIPHDPDKYELKFKFRNMHIHGLNDLFCYGSVSYIDQYVNTLDLIPMLYNKEKVDYCPENFLAASLIMQNTPVHFQKMEQRIVRS